MRLLPCSSLPCFLSYDHAMTSSIELPAGFNVAGIVHPPTYLNKVPLAPLPCDCGCELTVAEVKRAVILSSPVHWLKLCGVYVCLACVRGVQVVVASDKGVLSVWNVQSCKERCERS